MPELFSGETGPYCALCGQHVVHLDLTVREFLHETTHELTHWDGKIPTTFAALFLHSGRLTREFLAGRRARWLPPLRLYVICSLLICPVEGPASQCSARRIT